MEILKVRENLSDYQAIDNFTPLNNFEGGGGSVVSLLPEQKNPGPARKSSWIDALVISILSITALANSAYAIIAPFLPFEFKRKGID